MSTIETTGKTIEDAVRSGLVRLGRMKDEVDIEVLEEPKSGFFGFGPFIRHGSFAFSGDILILASIVFVCLFVFPNLVFVFLNEDL